MLLKAWNKIMLSKKVYVCCPGNGVTGGPELLHQFVDSLRKKNIDAYILYCPLTVKFSIPDVYKCYQAPSVNYLDVDFENSVVVIPEIFTGLAKYFKSAQIVIWWLSVDFYFDYTGNSPIKEYFKDKIKLLIGKKVKIDKLRSYKNYVQSEYARLFLLKNNINSSFLTDYLGAAHLNKTAGEYIASKKQNIIAYNPKKGVKFTQYLISKCKEYKFVPIQNMSPDEVRELLSKTKLYIDFGNHPGKDRFPREAVMAGCCIITGLRGSAGNNIDIPIPEKYKLDETKKDVIDSFVKITDTIFHNYENTLRDFEEYRHVVSNEPSLFNEQVSKFIKDVVI